MKRLLNFPPDTNIAWKSHDDSIAQRTAIDHARQEKGSTPGGHHGQGSDRRRGLSHDESGGKENKETAS
jgi:translation initiation factor 4E